MLCHETLVSRVIKKKKKALHPKPETRNLEEPEHRRSHQHAHPNSIHPTPYTRNPKPEILKSLHTVVHINMQAPDPFTLRPTTSTCTPQSRSPYPRQSLRRCRQKSISSEGSGFQKWRSPSEALLNEFTPSNTLAWTPYTLHPTPEILKSFHTFGHINMHTPNPSTLRSTPKTRNPKS